MHKLKRAAKELRDYLCRDSHAQELLDDVMRVANELRTDVRDGVVQFENSQKVNRSLMERLRDAEKKAKDAQAEMEKKSQELRGALLRCKRLSESLAECRKAMEPDTEAMGTRKEITKETFERLLNAVQKRYKRMPEGVNGKQQFFLEDAVKTFSFAEFSYLGMLVSVCALANVPVRVIAKTRINLGDDDKLGAAFMRLYKRWIAVSTTDQKITGVQTGNVRDATPW